MSEKAKQEIEAVTRRLNLTRRAHRGQMTKLSNHADELISNVGENKDNLELIEGLIESMEAKIKLLSDLDTEIIHVTSEEQLEATVIDCDEYLESLNVKVRSFKTVCKHLRSASNEESSQSMNMSLLNNSLSQVKRKINLPKLILPRFDGDLLKWISFIDAFKAAVASDENLDDIQKFQYLNAQLDGEAARTIAGLPLSNANYHEALSLLETRYGQPHKIISCYMKALWELPKPSDNVESLKKFYDNMETYIRGLRSLGKTENAYGDLLVPIIFEKIPSRVKTQISREHGDRAWLLPELKDAIYKEIQANLAGIGFNDSEHTKSITASTATFHVGSKPVKRVGEMRPNASSASQIKWAFCKNNHYSNECIKVTDVQKRRDIAKRDHLCFNCLRMHHNVRDCQAKGRCRTCHRKHHTSLCISAREQSADNQSVNSTDQKSESLDTKLSDTHVALTPTGQSLGSGPVLLKTAKSKLWNYNTAITGNILLDEGAQRTFVTENTIRELGYVCKRSEDINLSTFGANNASMKRVDVADLKLETKSGSMLDLSALVVSKISTPVKNYVQSAVVKHPYLQNLQLADHVDKDMFEINLLVGADFYWSIVEDKIIRGPGPTAVSSKLGFLLSGPSHLNVSTLNTMIYKIMVSSTTGEERLTDYWDLETIGIKEDISQEKTCEFEEYRDKQLFLKDGKYTASLPWKSNHAPLPTNYEICENRTRAMVKRLPNDLRKTYDRIITDQVSRGFIEMVENDDNTQGHYIPHHAVYKDSPTTPIRIVYDCSCKRGDNPSLNECLDVGPCLTKDLVEILIRFRLHTIGFVSDIEKAFLNIQLDECDRNYTKFMWLSDPEDPDSVFKTFRFKAILFGSVSSPFILNASLKTHLESDPNHITKDLQDNIYVDNLVSGTSNVNDAIKYYKHSFEIMKQGGFKLRSWATNNSTLRDVISQDGMRELDPVVKVLGLNWNIVDDVLNYNLHQKVNSHSVHTKREVLKLTSSLFDPLGILQPVHIRAKIFIQKLWQANLDWDTPLSEKLEHEWCIIQDDLETIRNISIKRPYFSENCDDSDSYELHVFADASCQAYGAVVYLKHSMESKLVISKSRVKPLKDITLPRLELLAAFVATRLVQFVMKALSHLQIIKIILWSDSQITLHWIHSNKKLPTFVNNRVKFIREAPFTDIKYCPTTDNPADLLTRGITPNEFKQSKLWMNGPSWLLDGDWPICDLFDSAILACQADTLNTDEFCGMEHYDAETQICSVSSCNLIISPAIDSVIDINRFGSIGKLFRVTAYVLRFIDILMKRRKQSNMKDFISVPELETTQKLWIKSIQCKVYSQEIQDMKNKVKKKSSLVHQLNLFIDEQQLIRCGGRFQNADIKFSSKYPLLIPRTHYFTQLVVKQAHVLVLHAGLGTTVTFIRNNFWIPQIRQVVKSVLRFCVTCRKVSGKPYRKPETPPLPKCRLEEAPPFSITGVDFTGALYYRTQSGTSKKAYICLFTCAVNRALHLEVVTNMSTGTFLQAFRRFAARRSLPTHMISDNGSTFLAAEAEIRELCRDCQVNNYLAHRNVQWTFIPKRAPWFGGFYERLVGITKNILKKNLGHRLVTLDELVTIVTEIEAIINDRPITYLPSTFEEPHPLTPSMLLHGRTITAMPHLDITQEEVVDADFGDNKILLHQRSKQLDRIFTQVWSRWRDEYLPALRETHMHHAKGHKGQTVNTIKVGDMVLVHDDISKRVHWPLAVVTKLKFGNDGLARSAEIRMKQGTSNRPISKLYPLEVKSDIPERDDEKPESDNNHDNEQLINIRPIREAATKARTLIKQLSNE